MKILAILENKNKRLRAYLPDFISPFAACMTRHCTVHDTPSLGNPATYICPYAESRGTTARCNYVDSLRDSDIYILVKTDIIDATNYPNVPKDIDGYIVVSLSLHSLLSYFERSPITVDLTWDNLLAMYTQKQLLQAYVNLPIPATVVDLHGRSTAGISKIDPSTGEINWPYANGIAYLNYNQAFKRPQAYTLDNIPGLTAHLTSKIYPNMEDQLFNISKLTDITLRKDLSCNVQLANCIAVVNGLLYRCEMSNGDLVIPGSLELFMNQVSPYASVMLIDFTELIPNAKSLQQVYLSDCTFQSATHDDIFWKVIYSTPSSLNLSGTVFLSFDGRLIQTNQIGTNLFSFVLSDREIQHMKERDMQMTGRFLFNTRFVRLRDNTEDWIKAQFDVLSDETTTEILNNLDTSIPKWQAKTQTVVYSDTVTNAEKHLLATNEFLAEDGANYHRSFVFVVPNTGIYIHEYMVNARLNYNGLLVHGNVEGLLQSTKGQEIFEHVISSYLSMRTLSPIAWYTWRNGTKLLYTRDVNPAVGDVAYTSRKYVEDQCTIADALFQFDADGNKQVLDTTVDDSIVVYNIEALTKESTTSDTVVSITVNGTIYTKEPGTMQRLLYGSDAHLLGYKPYEFLTTLEKHDTASTSPDIAFISTPHVDCMAESAVVQDSREFRLLDIVSLT